MAEEKGEMETESQKQADSNLCLAIFFKAFFSFEMSIDSHGVMKHSHLSHVSPQGRILYSAPA